MSTNVDFPGLFPEQAFSRHELPGKPDSDVGHEFPFASQVSRERLDGIAVSGISIQEGVSVSFEEAAQALEEVTKLYSNYNRRKPDTHYSQTKERAKLQPVLKEQELAQLGYDSADDIAAISAIASIRRNIGVKVSSEDRSANLARMLGRQSL